MGAVPIADPMRLLSILLLVPLLCLQLLSTQGLAQDTVFHQLEVDLHPERQALVVRDTITMPQAWKPGPLSFRLHEGLTVLGGMPAIEAGENDGAGAQRYTWAAPTGNQRTFTVEYEGRIAHEFEGSAEEYVRSFQGTKGVIDERGVYLAGESLWIPHTGDGMIQFKLRVTAPSDWHVISQGQGTSQADSKNGARSEAVWSSDGPMEQVYLVGGPLQRFADRSNNVETLVYLHADDAGLANKYLSTTDRYLRMYADLFGDYPYAKFALVENFWETGYGMPSFTLLGEKVIRMPFILHSSYPHEILHNWWGNSVFVDYRRGNWCEGLTAYLADHLVKESRGEGATYRRDTLKKYQSYVREGRDFPLREFRSRHSGATEAVGYGKSLMLFHMLRMQHGDGTLIQGLRHFYEKYQGSRASFDDLKHSFMRFGGDEMGPWMDQWLDRTGAPQLAIQSCAIHEGAQGVELRLELAQTQAGPAYDIQLPIILTYEEEQGGFTVQMTEKAMTVTRQLPRAPLALAIDPDFDVFRLLDPKETPPTLGQLFGDPSIVAIVPSDATAARYQPLIDAWSGGQTIEVVTRDQISEWPADKNVWVFGPESRPVNIEWHWADAFWRRGPKVSHFSVEGQEYALGDHCVVTMARKPGEAERVIGYVHIGSEEAAAGLARKLPHYGRYSYLAFEGAEPTNVAKGQWPATESPLFVDLRREQSAPLPKLEPAQRTALAQLPPEFSSDKLRRHVNWLADPKREGRGLGSAGLAASAEYIARQMELAGLEPGGDDGTWFQSFEVPAGPDGQPVTARNVVGILPGARLPQESFVIGAHYDHLGMGWPEAYAGNENQVHPGADDNASGVAVMLELAANLVSQGAPTRSLVVVAFSAEEAGLYGSRHYVANPALPRDGIFGMLNFDSVGRLGDGKVRVHGTGTCYEWPHIFRGVGFETGIQSQAVPEMIEGSDHAAFIEAGIPAVHLFTGGHEDYHRPGDVAAKIDGRGMVRIATLSKSAVQYMLDRTDPLRITIAGQESETPPTTPSGSRRVSFGSMPDFQFEGPGVRFENITEDSPADQAGFQAGDILIELDGQDVDDLRAFSNLLKTFQPGQTVEAVVIRGEEEVIAEVTLVAR